VEAFVGGWGGAGGEVVRIRTPGVRAGQHDLATRAIEITRGHLAAFLDLHLRRIPQPLLDGPTPANPEVRFNPMST
jgi:hypothetical protein